MPFFFFFNDTATTEIYTLSLHDALPIAIRDDQDRAGQRSRAPLTLHWLPGLDLYGQACSWGQCAVRRRGGFGQVADVSDAENGDCAEDGEDGCGGQDGAG